MKFFSFLLISVTSYSAAVVFYPDSVFVSVDGIVKQLRADDHYQPVYNDDDFKQVSEVSMLTKYALEPAFEPTLCTFYEELSGGDEGTVSTVDRERNLTNAPVSIGKYRCKPGLSYIPLRQEHGSFKAS